MWSNSDPISVPLSVTVVPTVKQSDPICPLHHTSAIQLGSYSQTVILSVLYTIPVQYNLVPTAKQSDLICPLHHTSAI